MDQLIQCGETTIHPPHDDCPGLDGTEVPDPALTVTCPDCMAPPQTPCRTSNPALTGSTHAERRRTADLRGLEQGTCDLCGAFMVRGSVEGAPVDAWHPDPADHGCPVLPDPSTAWNDYALAVNLGRSPGHPGLEHFVSTAPARLLFCRECSEGKHINCDGTAWDNEADAPAPCTCPAQEHHR